VAALYVVVEISEEAVLAIALPAGALFELLAEDQEWVLCHLVAMVRLPLAFDPDDPNVHGVNGSWDEPEEAEDDIDPEVDGEPLDEPDGDRRQEKR